MDIWIKSLEPVGEPREVVDSPREDLSPTLSPDARYLAYAAQDSPDDSEIYVTTCRQCRPDLNLPGGLWKVSVAGGTAPVWSRDGRELFYLQGATMMVVRVRTDPMFDHDPAQRLFDYSAYMRDQFGQRNYDASPNGQRFVMVKRGSLQNRINIIVNWFQELMQRVPAR